MYNYYLPYYNWTVGLEKIIEGDGGPSVSGPFRRRDPKQSDPLIAHYREVSFTESQNTFSILRLRA